MVKDFSEYTITEYHAALLRGAVTSQELTRWYLDRIEALNEKGPELRAVITVNPEAVVLAKAADDYVARNRSLSGPLHGVPVLLKDQAETKGLRTTFGNKMFAQYIPDADSCIVEKVKEAGGFIIAKSAMNDLACGYSGHCTMVYETKNPYDLTRDPGGSSSGVGCGIAANLAMIGIGEDTGGSIRVPASYNNLFGIRVTAGLISRRGLQGLVPVQDTSGPMARTVKDLTTLLDAMVGYDPEDPLTELAKGSPYVGRFHELLTLLPAWSDMKIGVLESAFITGWTKEDDEIISKLVRGAIEKIKLQGAQVVEGLEIDDLLGWFDKTSLYGFVSRKTLSDFFAAHGKPVQSYEEFLEKKLYNEVLSTFTDIKNGTDDPESDPEYTKALLNQRYFRETVLNLMAKNDVDILAYPTVRILPPKLEGCRSGVNTAAYPTNTIVGSQAILPAMSIPVGFSPEGVPVGMEILARPLREDLLIQLAALWEKLAAPRRAPQL